MKLLLGLWLGWMGMNMEIVIVMLMEMEMIMEMIIEMLVDIIIIQLMMMETNK